MLPLWMLVSVTFVAATGHRQLPSTKRKTLNLVIAVDMLLED